MKHILPALSRLSGTVALAAILAAGAQAAEKLPPRQVEFFESKIRPVLVQHCYECHSADSKEIKGGLRLDTREHIRMGGESGEAVIPGNARDSLLLEAMRYDGLEMPPKNKLSDEVIADFEQWIARGAVDPRDDAEPPATRTEAIDLQAAREFWAFQPVTRPAVPQVRDRSWPVNPIDHFVLARLEAEKLAPVEDADRRTLVRRLYFDLIGLPPTPEQVEAFVNDESPRAWETLVDELLASERFGERWGRHWLDVARYAESSGRERNHTFPHAWRYRDYVIDAFNADLPYNEFITEQIAGDLLEHDNDQQRRQRMIATGFLAIGPKTLNERNRRQFDLNTIDDQLDTVGRAVLGLTIGCARCHDHKFDPIPTADYYALAGIFSSTETLFGGTEANGVRQATALLPLGDDVEVAKQVGRMGQPPQAARRQQQLERQLAAARGAKDRDQIRELQRQLKRLARRQPAAQPSGEAVAMAVREGTIMESPIYIRGEVGNVGERVARGYLSILSDESSPRIPTDQSGRRQLAEWLTDSRNPLTARVFVNRLWQHLFGVGLVASSGNFGASGESPSHPELLDWLAADCLENGWSRKQMIRTIVLSRTYRLAARQAPRNDAADPENRLLWRHPTRRLDAEALRDAILLASGQIDLERPGGSLVQTLGDRAINDSRPLDNLEADALVCRSVYLPIVRNVVPEPLQLFDFAEPDMVVSRRQETTSPTQSLYLMNSDFARRAAERLAARTADEATDEDRVRRMYLHAVARPPEPEEIEQALAFIAAIEEQLQEPWTLLAQALFASAEFRYVR